MVKTRERDNQSGDSLVFANKYQKERPSLCDEQAHTRTHSHALPVPQTSTYRAAFQRSCQQHHTQRFNRFFSAQPTVRASWSKTSAPNPAGDNKADSKKKMSIHPGLCIKCIVSKRLCCKQITCPLKMLYSLSICQ